MHLRQHHEVGFHMRDHGMRDYGEFILSQFASGRLLVSALYSALPDSFADICVAMAARSVSWPPCDHGSAPEKRMTKLGGVPLCPKSTHHEAWHVGEEVRRRLSGAIGHALGLCRPQLRL